MRLDEAGLDDYTDRFTSSAWRHETRDRYCVGSDDDGFERYLAGEEPSPGFGSGWHRWLNDRRAEGRHVFRVRILYRQPSPYLLFEIEWPYLMNAAHGEQTRILDLTERARPSELVDDEFWMLDDDRVAVLTYDEVGRFQHADTYEGHAAARWVVSAHAAWTAGEPLSDWWRAHPQHHRANRLDAGA